MFSLGSVMLEAAEFPALQAHERQSKLAVRAHQGVSVACGSFAAMSAHPIERRLSGLEARRVLLGAQGLAGAGFAGATPDQPGARQLGAFIRRLGLLQLDSINVFERSHYLPVFARLGAFDRATLDALTFDAGTPRGRFTEYVAHEAAIIPVEDLPLFGWRMRQMRERYAAEDSWLHSKASLQRWILDELRAKGPMAASEIEHDKNRRAGPWWGWSEVKRTLELLFRTGDVAIAGRRRFERRYGLPEQVLPPGTMDFVPERTDAIRELVRRSLVAIGVGTTADVADYFRLPVADTALALGELGEAGVAVPVRVDGWPRAAWMDGGARVPRRVERVRLLSPFDPVVWDRDRALRMFGFHYRIEVYTPAPQRRFGYYSLPLLVDATLAGRIDLKSDRQRGVLRVQSAWLEPGAEPGVAERVAPELRRIAAWQGLDGIEVQHWGDLAPALAGALGVGLVERVGSAG